MDVSPKTLREVEFREKMRGYHPEDVDQFLERVAAGIEVLQDRLRQAIERAQRAEQAATEAGGNDDALGRTLLLAQRTADLAVQEAREQAARIIASAEQQTQAAVSETDQRVHSLVADAERRSQVMLAEADQRSQAMLADAEQRSQTMLADAEQRSQAMIADAEYQARRGHEEALTEVRNDLATLEMTRQRLQLDAETLSRWVAEHRAQLRAALEDALTRVDQIDLSPPPSARAPYSVEAPKTDVSNTDVGAVRASAVPVPAAPQGPDEGVDQPRPQTAEHRQWAPAATGQPAAPEEMVSWPAEPEPGQDQNGEADPYFAELRRAISDPEPLAPRPEGDHQGAAGGHAATGDS